jgi:hypothetical protein
MRFPHLAHRSAAAHKLHNTTATTQYEFDSGIGETFSRLPALAYSSPESVQTTGTVAHQTDTDEETEALARLLRDTIDADRLRFRHGSKCGKASACVQLASE